MEPGACGLDKVKGRKPGKTGQDVRLGFRSTKTIDLENQEMRYGYVSRIDEQFDLQRLL